MRETIRLLCEHVHVQLAKIIESYILPGDNEGDLKHVLEIFKVGHWELCSQYFSGYWSSHIGLDGAIDGNSIHLVRVMVELSTEDLGDYIRRARGKKCDRDIIELLQLQHDRNRKRIRFDQ